MKYVKILLEENQVRIINERDDQSTWEIGQENNEVNVYYYARKVLNGLEEVMFETEEFINDSGYLIRNPGMFLVQQTSNLHNDPDFEEVVQDIPINKEEIKEEKKMENKEKKKDVTKIFINMLVQTLVKDGNDKAIANKVKRDVHLSKDENKVFLKAKISVIRRIKERYGRKANIKALEAIIPKVRGQKDVDQSKTRVIVATKPLVGTVKKVAKKKKKVEKKITKAVVKKATPTKKVAAKPTVKKVAKPMVKKATVKKVTKKPVVKKPVVKKATKKVVAKKPVVKKAVIKKATPAKKVAAKPTVKKVAKPMVKKATVKKVTKKPIVKKVPAKKKDVTLNDIMNAFVSLKNEFHEATQEIKIEMDEIKNKMNNK